MVGKALDMSEANARYPRTVTCGGTSVEIRRMTPGHGSEVNAFVRSLDVHDLLFLRRDISESRVVEAWMNSIEEGRVQSLVAYAEGKLVGCTAIIVENLSWSRHVGELRVLVGPSMRGKGLGRTLIQECFVQALELGLEKLCAQMTVDQASAIGVFEELGFRAEAVLQKHVKDREGRLHDLALLSHDVTAVHSRLDAYGVTSALSQQESA